MRTLLLSIVLSIFVLAPGLSQAQSRGSDEDKDKPPPANISAQTGKILTEAIDALNAENYAGAQAAIAKLKMDRLSPYERSRVEQILASIADAQGNEAMAQQHLQAAIDAGGLNENEVSQTRYQIAQLYLAQEKWKEGAAALETWFQTATNPNSSAYYLLAVAYYQMEMVDKALVNAQKAVDLSEKPQESWIQLVLALNLQKENWQAALPLLNRLINLKPENKTYWSQLSSVYGQLEQYEKSLAVMQLAYGAGLLTEDSDVRRLADLLVFNNVPYRCGELLDEAIAKKLVKVDDKLYQKQSNCWIAAREFTKAIEPLSRAAQMSGNGDLYVRLGEVQVQREDWGGAEDALTRGINKGGLQDTGYAQLMLGIALFNQKKMAQAEEWFQRAKSSSKSRKTAEGYLQLIRAQAG